MVLFDQSGKPLECLLHPFLDLSVGGDGHQGQGTEERALVVVGDLAHFFQSRSAYAAPGGVDDPKQVDIIILVGDDFQIADNIADLLAVKETLPAGNL